MRNQLFIRVFALAAIFAALTAFMLPLNTEQTGYSGEKFSKLSIAVKSKVYIEQGESYKLDIQTDENTLQKISVEYNSDELEIKCKTGSRIDEAVLIYITTPTLEAISLAGSSDLYIENTFKTGKMHLSLAGSGKMEIKDLKADKVSASIAGSGNILLAGGNNGAFEDFSIAGSGKIDAAGFAAAKAEVDIAGSGDCSIFASENLKVSIAGSGNVHYKGSPVLNSETAGSGRVSKL